MYIAHYSGADRSGFYIVSGNFLKKFDIISILLVFQEGQRKSEKSQRSQLDLCVVLFKARSGSTIGSLVEHSKRQVRGFVGCNKMLEAGEYVVVPLAFNHWHTGLEDLSAYPRWNKVVLK